MDKSHTLPLRVAQKRYFAVLGIKLNLLDKTLLQSFFALERLDQALILLRCPVLWFNNAIL